MRPALASILSRQGGLFTRGQALSAGYTVREFAALTKRRTGSWVRIRYGVYTTREHWAAAEGLERAKLIDRAALLVCNDESVLSHSSAARWLGLALYGVDDSLAHLNRPGQGQTARIESGVKHHRGRLDPDEVMEVDGVRVTVPARTALDIAAEFGYRSGLVTADSALHLGSPDTHRSMRALAEAHECAPNGPTIRAVADQADGRAATPIETLGRATLQAIGIDDLDLQHVIRLPTGRHAITDLYSRSLNHVFECDGRIKYQDGYDDLGRRRTAEQVLWEEKKREDAVRSTGRGFSRLLWPDVQEGNLARTRERIWQEISQQSAGNLRDVG